MNLRQSCCLLALLITGCSQSPGTSEIVEQSVTVMTADSQEKTIPLADLYDQSTGAPAFESVLVIDRQGNRRVFVSPDELMGQTQASARYVLVTSPVEENE